jgi:hypothetical protein
LSGCDTGGGHKREGKSEFFHAFEGASHSRAKSIYTSAASVAACFVGGKVVPGQ